MVCDQCGTPLTDDGQRFCNQCGAEVTQPGDDSPDDSTDGSTVTADDDTITTDDDAATADDDRTDAAPPDDTVTADDDTVTTDDDPTVPVLYDLAADEPELLRLSTTLTLPAITPSGTPTTEVPTTQAALDPDPSVPFHLARPTVGVVVLLGTLTGLLALVGMFPRVVTIRTTSTSPAFATGDWLVADLGTNLPASLIVALVALLAGLVGAAYRQRWGYGLVGGSGLAVAGWSALTLGLVERPVGRALDAAQRPSAEAFTVTITRDLGYGMIAAAGIGGILVFVASLGRAGPDRRRSLNPWIAALGALAALVAAAGPLLPEGTASIEDNWTLSGVWGGAPAAFLIGRLVQVGLLAFTGVIGFLMVRRYGLGLAVGGATVTVWLTLSSLLGLGTDPIGPGYSNPGSLLGAVDLHAVTIAGTAALVVLIVAAVIVAYDLAAREP